ncbi:MAG TPA: serine hydrolase [Thermoanaerobaculia bacterium]|nr:serine hydrolase [Thermoanaerobaculia bacterium]
MNIILLLLFSVAFPLPKSDAVIGVAAIDLDSGKTVSVRGEEPFPMASVVKLPLAIEVLRRVDAGQLRLDQTYTLTPRDFGLAHSPIRDAAKGKPVTLTLRTLITSAVSDSDNTAGDYLLRLVTPAAVTERMRALHADGIRVDRTEKEIVESFSTKDGVARYATDPRDTAAPLGMAALLGMVARNREGLKPASHELLMHALSDSSNPVRIARLLPKGSSVAHKSGTMPGTLNDAGIITSPDGKHHIAIAIFTKGATRSTEAERGKLVSEIARDVYARLTTNSRPPYR